jgi:hypothetical protein
VSPPVAAGAMLAGIAYRGLEVEEAAGLSEAMASAQTLSPSEDLYVQCDFGSVEYMLPADYCTASDAAQDDVIGVDVVHQQQICYQQLQLLYEQRQALQGQQAQPQKAYLGQQQQGQETTRPGRLALGSRVPGWAPCSSPYEVSVC